MSEAGEDRTNSRVALSGLGRSVEVEGCEPVGALASHAISLFELMGKAEPPREPFGLTAAAGSTVIDVAGRATDLDADL